MKKLGKPRWEEFLKSYVVTVVPFYWSKGIGIPPVDCDSPQQVYVLQKNPMVSYRQPTVGF